MLLQTYFILYDMEILWPRGKNDQFTDSGLGKWFSTLGVEWWRNTPSSSCVLCSSATLIYSKYQPYLFLSSHLPLVMWSEIERQMLDLRHHSGPSDISGSFYAEEGMCTHILWAANLFVVVAHLCFVCVFSSFILRNPSVSFLYTKDYLWVVTYQNLLSSGPVQ